MVFGEDAIEESGFAGAEKPVRTVTGIMWMPKDECRSAKVQACESETRLQTRSIPNPVVAGAKRPARR